MPETKNQRRVLSAINFRLDIISALEGEAVQDPRIMENNLMEKFHWTYNELLDTPLEVIMSIGFIQGTQNDREKLSIKKHKDKEAINRKGKP